MTLPLGLRPRRILLLGVLASTASACSLLWNFQDFEPGDAAVDSSVRPDAPALVNETGSPVDARIDHVDSSAPDVTDARDGGDSGDASAGDASDAMVCPSGYHECSGACSSNFSPNSCGPTSCLPCTVPMYGLSFVCNGAACVGTCVSSLILCEGGPPAGTCVDPTSDPAHCGGCGTRCPAPTGNGIATCTSSVCGIACDGGQTACPVANPRACVDIDTDSRNCGACSTVCLADDAGVGGRCVEGGCQ